jgi:hypothetical protein
VSRVEDVASVKRATQLPRNWRWRCPVSDDEGPGLIGHQTMTEAPTVAVTDGPVPVIA